MARSTLPAAPLDAGGAPAESSPGLDQPPAGSAGLRIGDAAAAAGVSARTLRYYEELGLIAPSGYTPGGERRYQPADLAQLGRVLELREVLGMNLEEIKGFLASENRLDELRAAYRASQAVPAPQARAEQEATLQEALDLNQSLAAAIDEKLARMDAFRARLAGNAQRCRDLLAELRATGGPTP